MLTVEGKEIMKMVVVTYMMNLNILVIRSFNMEDLINCYDNNYKNDDDDDDDFQLGSVNCLRVDK